MKRVTLVSLSTSTIKVQGYRDTFEYHNLSMREPMHIGGTHEFTNETIGIEHAEINWVKVDGHGFYTAVKREVWEYLYMLSNPVTAKSQEERIKNLAVERDKYRKEVNFKQAIYNKFHTKVCAATWLTRLKWLFTGVR